MTTLAQGSSATLTVGDGGTVTIATNGGLGTAVVTPALGSASTVSFGPWAHRQKFGPFVDGATVQLTNASCASFDYEYDTANSPAVQALVSGDGKVPQLAWQYNGTRSAPAATFLGAATNGLFGLASPILIPAAQIQLGKSVTEVEATLRKTGAGTGGWALKMGGTNGLGDTDIHPAIGSSFSATDPQEFTVKFRLTYSAGAVHVVGERRISGSTAPLTETKETSVTLSGDLYLNLALNSFSAGTNVSLVSLSVRHFQ